MLAEKSKAGARKQIKRTISDAPKAEPTPESQTKSVPGPLIDQELPTIEIHTRIATKLFYGRKKTEKQFPVIGLHGFASLSRNIFEGALNDDPYADRYLCLLEEQIEIAEKTIKSYDDIVQKPFDEAAELGINIPNSISSKPTIAELRVSHYGMQGAILLAKYDRFASKCLAAAHRNLLEPQKAFGYLDQCGHVLRSLFTLPTKYKFLFLDRPSVKARNAVAIKAEGIMGEIEPEYLNKQRRPKYGPVLMGFGGGVEQPRKEEVNVIQKGES